MDNISKWTTITPENTALIVIDMQVNFCSSNGKASQRGKSISNIQKIIPELNNFVNKINELGILTIFTKFISGSDITPENLKIAVEKEGFDFPCIKGSEESHYMV